MTEEESKLLEDLGIRLEGEEEEKGREEKGGVESDSDEEEEVEKENREENREDGEGKTDLPSSSFSCC